MPLNELVLLSLSLEILLGPRFQCKGIRPPSTHDCKCCRINESSHAQSLTSLRIEFEGGLRAGWTSVVGVIVRGEANVQVCSRIFKQVQKRR